MQNRYRDVLVRVNRFLPLRGPLLFTYADVAQLAEQLICNQQVNGSSPLIGLNMDGFPSGQRGQTVNLLAMPTGVRIHPPPPAKGPVQNSPVKQKHQSNLKKAWLVLLFALEFWCE